MAQTRDGRSSPSTNHFQSGGRVSNPSPTRPQSSYTSYSTFADSAVDMDAMTSTESPNPTLKDAASYFEPSIPQSPGYVDQSLADKMRQLAAVAWTLEQDESMPSSKRRKLHRMLSELEAQLEAEPLETPRNTGSESDDPALELEKQEHALQEEAAHFPVPDSEEEDEWIDESDLIAVRNSLAATVRSMRLRQEEQAHLHQLTIHKLEAVAQKCLIQEQQAEDLLREMRGLRHENHTVSSENDRLREQIANMQIEADRTEVAVEAMSSAVTGLEGWIEGTQPTQTPTAPRPKRQRAVIRGRGRFRGRYYVEEDGDNAVAYSWADAESQELHDGVKAWLRGFRDVEEELRHHESLDRTLPQGRFRTLHRLGDDDWGDFVSPSKYNSP